jgi:CHAD domain-containing protein
MSIWPLSGGKEVSERHVSTVRVVFMKRCSDPGYRILAARSLRKQVKQLVENLSGIRRGDDIEAIHRARVASRRVRAALAMFRSCWKRKQVDLWKKQIRRLAHSLGEARDDDVVMEFLVARLAAVSDPALVPGIAAVLNHFEQVRKWLQPRVLKAADRFAKCGAVKAMQASVRAMLAESKGVPLVIEEGSRGHAVKSLGKRLQHLLKESAGLAAPERHEQHHAMRIAAKRLRYSLELARPLYAGDLSDADDAVRKLQALLGEIHDCDVWGITIAEFARREAGEIQLSYASPRPFERLRPGLDYLRQERQDRRQQVFDELATYWQELKERGVWDRLETILEWGGTRAKLHDAGLAEVAPPGISSGSVGPWRVSS